MQQTVPVLVLASWPPVQSKQFAYSTCRIARKHIVSKGLAGLVNGALCLITSSKFASQPTWRTWVF